MTVPAELRRNAALVWVAGLVFAVLLLIVTDFSQPLSAEETAALRPLDADPDGPWGGLGLAVLGLPVSAWDAPAWLVRLYFVVLSSLGVVAAFRRWARPAGKVSWTSGIVFAASWVPLVSGGTVQPYLLGALGAVLAGGFAMRWCVERDRGALVGIAGGVALTTVFVPLAGIALGIGLLVVVAVWVRRWALPGLVAAGVGVAVGLLPWLVESAVRFGDIGTRIAETADGAASATVAQYLRVIDGPLRPVAGERPSVAAIVWVLVLAALATTGILQRRWNHRRNAALVGVTLSTAMVLPFTIIVATVDARLLLPAYGLLVVAVSAGLLDVWHIVAQRVRFGAVTVGLIALSAVAVIWQVSLAATHF